MKTDNTTMGSEPKSGLPSARGGLQSMPCRLMLAAVGLGAALVFTLLEVSNVPGHAQNPIADPSDSEIQAGLAIAPVPLDLRGKNRALVGRGSYIVNALSFCNDCHTSVAPEFVPGGNPHLGQPAQIDPLRYLIGGRQFGPVGVGPRSRNLTPDPLTGLPAGYTFEQFLHVMRTGEDLKHLAPQVPSAEIDLLQTMPWPSLGKLTDRDMLAIYEYLRAVPSRPGFPQ